MPDHNHVYQNQTELYDLLISKQPGLLEVIESIVPVQGLDVLDLGAGSGRLTAVLAPHARTVLALDRSAEMLEVNRRKLTSAGITNCRLQTADHRRLPADNESADLIVAGWTICYLASSNAEDYEAKLQQVMEEMHRVLRPGGTIVIFETMGTGYETPQPPDFLRAYYALLEEKYGFAHQWLRLDYQFDSLEQAETCTRFFFGDELADRVVRENWVRVPECAGMWWWRKPGP